MMAMESKLERGRMNENATRATVWLWLTAPIAVLVAIAAGSELLVDGLFRRDETNFVAQAIGQDYVTLAVALPILVVSAVLANRCKLAVKYDETL
jgi:hypothetical protein